MNFLYTSIIVVYTLLLKAAAPFSKKASLWVKGRRGWYKKLKYEIKGDGKLLWVHCASLGEFEQGRPVIEELRQKMPEYQILITFFSPSGYEIRKDWKGADYTFYLPADTPWNARRFIKTVNPAAVLFVKYEFWANFIKELHRQKIPVLLVSGIFRPDQHFFRWYGGYFRMVLRKFSAIFVQDKRSAELLSGIGIEGAVVAGDTRFDRVLALASTACKIDLIEKFACGEKVIVAGSSWQPDEEIIARFVASGSHKIKWIIAPHEIEKSNIERLERLFQGGCIKYSEPGAEPWNARVLIIDNIGMLTSVYVYALAAVVGGGFGRGIHNILEPASRSVPVLFGPNHHKFNEAKELLECGGALTFSDYREFEEILTGLLGDEVHYIRASEASGEYVRSHAGATKKIVDLLLERRY